MREGAQITATAGSSGSIVLANQRIALEPPSESGQSDGAEVRLKTYDMFQNRRSFFEKAAFTEGLKRVSQRDYEKGATRKSQVLLGLRRALFLANGSRRRPPKSKSFRIEI